MIVMAREPDAGADFTLQDFLSFDTPEGYRAELIDGEIVVTPPPDGNHERCIMRIVKQVLAASATPMDFSGQKGLIVPVVEGQGRVIPDITFAPAKLDLFLDAPTWMPATASPWWSRSPLPRLTTIETPNGAPTQPLRSRSIC
jgi:Uma2 family endonuclease